MQRDIIVISRTRREFLKNADSFFAPDQRFADMICLPACGLPETILYTLTVPEAIKKRKEGAVVVEHNEKTGNEGHYRALKAQGAPDDWLKTIWESVKASCVQPRSMCIS